MQILYSVANIYLHLAAKLIVPPINVLAMMISSHLDCPP